MGINKLEEAIHDLLDWFAEQPPEDRMLVAIALIVVCWVMSGVE